MKILIYSKSFAPLIGGVESYVLLLASGLVQEANSKGKGNFKVMVVTATEVGEFNDSNFEFQVIRQPSFRKLVKLIYATDVIHLAGPSLLPLALGTLLCKKVVVEHHGYQASCPNGLLFYEPREEVCPGHFMGRRYSKCLRCNSCAVGWFASAKMLLLTFPRRLLCQLAASNLPITNHVFERLGLRNSQVIYYGVPEPKLDPSVKNSTTTESSAVCFAYLGRLVKEKGPKLLLQAAARLRTHRVPLRLKFIGDGPEREYLETLAEADGMSQRVEFTGFLKGASLAQALEEVAAVVMPSLMEETAGLAALEQMMRGRLVIASDIGGLGEIVDGVGLKFSPGDVSGLTQCLCKVLDEPSVVGELGRSAHERAVQMFEQRRMVSECYSLYEKLLAAPDTYDRPSRN